MAKFPTFQRPVGIPLAVWFLRAPNSCASLVDCWDLKGKHGVCNSGLNPSFWALLLKSGRHNMCFPAEKCSARPTCGYKCVRHSFFWTKIKWETNSPSPSIRHLAKDRKQFQRLRLNTKYTKSNFSSPWHPWWSKVGSNMIETWLKHISIITLSPSPQCLTCSPTLLPFSAGYCGMNAPNSDMCCKSQPQASPGPHAIARPALLSHCYADPELPLLREAGVYAVRLAAQLPVEVLVGGDP